MSTPGLKKCKPFTQRADELAGHEPVVSYYCRLAAIEILMKARQAGQSNAEADTLMMGELDKAESAKKGLDLSTGRDTMEAFAGGVFDKVDSMDRAGTYNKSTCSMFYAAGVFLDVCAQFYDGELPPDLAEKSKYSKYRAVHILDCLKKGVAVTPPPAPAVDSLAAPSEAAWAAEAAPNAGYPAAAAPVATASSAAAPLPVSAPVPVAHSSPPVRVGGGGAISAGPAAKAEGKRQAEFAASALDFDDAATARKCLLEALRHLEG